MFTEVTRKDGSFITANEAESGVDYYCPHCGARMRVRKCTSRRNHFCLFQDYHRDSACKVIEQEKNVYRDVARLSVNGFQKSLRHTSPQGGRGKSGGKGKPQGEKTLPPNGLRQLVACGANKMDPNTPIEGGVLWDLLITPKSYYQIPNLQGSMGFRVIELWLRAVLDYHFRYVIHWDYKGKAYCMFFDHKATEELATELADQYFHDKKERTYGPPYWTNAKFNSVFVAGAWHYLSWDECRKICNQCTNGLTKDGRRCLGMWSADMDGKGCIYAAGHPNNRRGPKK